MSNKTAKDAVIAIGKMLREEIDSFKKSQTTVSPRDAGLRVAKAIQDQINLYKEELSKMQTKESGEVLEKGLFSPSKPKNDTVLGAGGKTINTGSLLPSNPGKLDIFRNKTKDKSGVIGATVGAGQHGAQFGLSPATVAAAKAKSRSPLAEPHKSPVLKPKELAKPVADAIAAKKDAAPSPLPAKSVAPALRDPEKMPVRDLKLKDGGRPEPKPSAPIENPAQAHPPVQAPTAMTPDRVKQLTTKPAPAPAEPDKFQEGVKSDFKQWVHDNILNPKPQAAAPAPKQAAPKQAAPKKAKAAAASVKKKTATKSKPAPKAEPKAEPKKEAPAPKKEEPKKESKPADKPKSKLRIIDVKDGETEAEAEARTKAEAEKEDKPSTSKGKKKTALPKWDKIGKGEEDLDKATNGLPGTPTSNEELAEETKTKKRKSVFGLLKKDALSVSKDPEKAMEKDRNSKAVLPEDKKEQTVGNTEANGKLTKQSEDLEKKSFLGGKDDASKMMTNQAMSQASQQSKNAKMPAQQQSIKMPSPSEHMDRANDLMHWMNPANHFQKMDELLEKRIKKSGKAKEDKETQ